MKHQSGLSNLAYEQIKSLILENKLKPGQFVNEAQLQEMLGLGRTPVREAVLKLAGNELITIHPRKGIEIAKISPKSIHDIFQIRLLMEPSILEISYQNLSEDSLIQFRSQFAEYRETAHLDLTQSIRLADLDNQLHLAIVSSMGNQYATQLMNNLVDKLTVIRSTVSTHGKQRFSVSNLEHIEIIDAILNGEIPVACQKLRKHIEISYEEAVKIIMQSY